MKSKKGFIATSLIYSFFLVFVAVMLALVNNYLSNKTVLDKFNSSVQDKLNSETYDIVIFTEGEIEVKDLYAVKMKNLIPNLFSGDKNPYKNTPFGKDEIVLTESQKILLIDGSDGGSMYNVENKLLNGHIYYSSLNYNKSNDGGQYESYFYGYHTETSIEKLSFGVLSIATNGNNKVSSIFEFDSNNFFEWHFQNKNGISSEVKIKEMMLIDLSSSYGDYDIPDKSWLDENIEFFEDEKNYYHISNNEYDGSRSIYLNSDTFNYNCAYSDGSELSITKNNNKIEFNNITGDIKCTITE